VPYGLPCLFHILGGLAGVWAVTVCLVALSPWGLPEDQRTGRAILMVGLLLIAGAVGAGLA